MPLPISTTGSFAISALLGGAIEAQPLIPSANSIVLSTICFICHLLI
ncbi:hypothetical protein TevJSym_ab00370 [endosymbiont of Tevnia jerichonana (vent Tica)]|uniref:Uncharacterized protein n=1 Tax=endosymbiont of Tevnia jerichonana (vent Tica) TaxID=1049564 RepID=G2FBK4_9GAMM|nr:hypothetical protein TevJSym_ab00370 [endosymbiont of Tevnia jerichonana (vent Tica)]